MAPIFLIFVLFFPNQTIASPNFIGVPEQLLCDNLFGSNSYAREMQRYHWKKWSMEEGWSGFAENDTQFQRFINERDIEAYKKLHPNGFVGEAYGLDSYVSWKEADRYLNEIPVGKLKLSTELFQNVNRIAGAGMQRFAEPLGHILPSEVFENRYGRLKKTPTLFLDALDKPISEDLYQALLKNKWLRKNPFVEVPGSEVGKRKGIVYAASADETPQKLRDLVKWYNDNKDNMDPVYLAADFARAFISIHPFMDGNGRTGRLIMDRILREHDLPPPLIKDLWNDMFLTRDQWRAKVRDGVVAHINIINQQAASSSFYRANSQDQKFYGRVDFSKKKPWRVVGNDGSTTSTSFVESQMVVCSGKSFVLASDGFLYSREGVPHRYHEGKLYPIADKTYMLYRRNGEFTQRNVTVQEYSRDGKETTTKAIRPDRKLNPEHRDVYRAHFDFMRKVTDGEIDPGKVEVVPYSNIDTANREAVLHLWPFEEKLLNTSAEIEGTTPQQILSLDFRGVQKNGEMHSQTIFESSAFISTEKISPTNVIAQYQKVDHELYELEQLIKEKKPELLPRIRDSRRRVHGAARTLLKPYFDYKEKVGSETFSTFKEKDIRVKVFDDYLAATKLKFENFDEAMENTDDSMIYLLRNDNGYVSKFGMHTEATINKIFNSLPGIRHLKGVVEKLNLKMQEFQNKYWEVKNKADSDGPEKASAVAELAKIDATLMAQLNKHYPKFQEFLNTFVSRLSLSRYSQKKVDKEFERAFVEFSLHASGSAPLKESNSYTSSPLLLAPASYGGNTNFPYASDGNGMATYLVNVPRSWVDWNFVSGFSGEYEFLIAKSVYPNRMKPLAKVKSEKEKVPTANNKDNPEMNEILDLIGAGRIMEEPDTSQNKDVERSPTVPEPIPQDP